MVLALATSAFGQSEPKVPFDLEKFQPVLSRCRLHSPRTSGNIAVKRGRFEGYELPGRFYLGEDGNTMVLGTTNPNSKKERSELRHNSGWLVGEGEKRYSARLRFDKPVSLGKKKSNIHLLQVYGTGKNKGPKVLVSWAGSWHADGEKDKLSAWVKGAKSHDLGPRPDGFFDLDLLIRDGKILIAVNKEVKVEEDISHLADVKAYFKTGNYNRGIQRPNAIEFEELTITTP
jgi:hypothetical protein